MRLFRSVLLSLAVAVAAFALSAPFLVIEHWLGFAVLGVVLVSFLARQRRAGGAKFTRAHQAGFLIATALLVPARFMADFAERGFDDGPFHGRPFTGDLSNLTPSERVPFRAGEIVVYNRPDGEPPVLVYRAGERVRWAHELFVSTRGDRPDPGTGENELHEIAHLRVSPGIVRDRLNFVGTWTYGAERGWAYVWKWGGIQRFFLSW